MRLHGGTITCRSSQGRGTTFALEILALLQSACICYASRNVLQQMNTDGASSTHYLTSGLSAKGGDQSLGRPQREDRSGQARPDRCSSKYPSESAKPQIFILVHLADTLEYTGGIVRGGTSMLDFPG